MGLYHSKDGARYEVIDSNFVKKLDGIQVSSTGAIRLYDGLIVKDTISIENNEPVKFDFNNFVFDEIIPGTKLFKILIEFGDGTKKLTAINISKEYSLIGSTFDEWLELSHQYDFQDTDTHDLKITFYSTAGDKSEIILHFDTKFKSIYELGTEFEIISANINMQNSISYMLRHKATDSVIVATGVK